MRLLEFRTNVMPVPQQGRLLVHELCLLKTRRFVFFNHKDTTKKWNTEE